MSRRAITAINWSAIAERIAESDKHILATFKAKSDQFLRKVEEYPESSPKIDWSFYKQRINVPGMVDNFQKHYESMQIPYPADNYTSIVETQAKEAKSNVEQFIAESNVEIQKFKEEINRINSMLPYSQMTMEEFYEAHPEMAINNEEKPSIWPHEPEFQPENIKPAESSH